MFEEHYTERRNIARERIVDSQRGKHVSRQDLHAEHMNKAREKFLGKELNVVSSQCQVVIKVLRHQTNGFVDIHRQGIGGLFLFGMYRRLAKDHFKAVDRITDRQQNPLKPPTQPEVTIKVPALPEEEDNDDDDDGEFFNPIAVPAHMRLQQAGKPERKLSNEEMKSLRLRESLTKAPSSEKKKKKKKKNRTSMEEEAVIQTIRASNAPDSPELKPPAVPRRKYGVYRTVRTPAFMKELEAMAATDGFESISLQIHHVSPKSSSSSSTHVETAPWKKHSGASTGSRWTSNRSSIRISTVEEVVPMSPVPDSPRTPQTPTPQEAPPVDSPPERQRTLELPQLVHPVVVTRPKLKRPRRLKPKPKAPAGPYMKQLFKEEELETFKRLKNRLFLERHRLQHHHSVRECSSLLRDWLDKNPARRSYPEDLEALMNTIQPEEEPSPPMTPSVNSD